MQARGNYSLLHHLTIFYNARLELPPHPVTLGAPDRFSFGCEDPAYKTYCFAGAVTWRLALPTGLGVGPPFRRQSLAQEWGRLQTIF
jgi:hypothetical protein